MLGEDAEKRANLEPPLVKRKSMLEVGLLGELLHRREDDLAALKFTVK